MVTLYADANCRSGPNPVPADDSCNAIYMQQTSYNSYIYTAGPPKNVGCQASGTSSPQGTTLVNEATICCSP